MRSSLASLVVASVVTAATVTSTAFAQPTLTPRSALASQSLATKAAATNYVTNVNPTFSCTGPVHAQAITLWERVARPYIAGLIDEGLRKGGDVYVLYDTQEKLQSFVDMTRRCRDVRQIEEITVTLSPVFPALQCSPATGVCAWICRGGPVCTPANQLLGNEVVLVSSQFLGLLGAVATDIVENVRVRDRTPEERAFLNNAASAMATQVNRWLSQSYFTDVAWRSSITPAYVKDAGSKYFFLDKDLWYMTSLSNLAELREAGVTFNTDGSRAFRALQDKDRQIASLFNLFLDRVTLINAPNGLRAEIDRGYWREFADDKYARYDGDSSPMLCRRGPNGKPQQVLRVPAKASYMDPDVGWDISHARRLVPALASFVRNRENLEKVFGYSNRNFHPIVLRQAFANQIVDKIWNHDSGHPLFSNFWDGSNGWYRVGYENGTGQCQAGMPPYDLAWSIPTGGYLEWGDINPTIRALGERLYQLTYAQDTESRSFVARFYREFAAGGEAGNTSSNVWRLSMLSSLIG